MFAPTAIDAVGFDPATQSVHALLSDADGESLLLTRAWESAAPGALDALARALTARTPIRHVAGVLHETGGLPQLDPWALSDGDQLCIPDLAAPDGAVRNLPIGAVPGFDDPLVQALTRAEDWLAGRLLAGPGAAAWRARGRDLATQLQRVGWSDLAESIAALAEAVDDPTRIEDAALAAPAIDMLLRLQLTREVLASAPE